MTKTISSYGGERAHPRTIATPESRAELSKCLREAVASARRVTFRGAGHALDTQSLGDDLVVNIEKLNHVDVDVTAGVVTAEGGAPWSKVLEKTLAVGFVPPIMVTSGETTVAGTMSSESLSRFSPSWGKESIHVKWFELMTLDGNVVHCSRSRNARIFRSAIGGLGYLGCIVQACVALIPLEGRAHVETVCVPFRGHRTMLRRLYDRARRVMRGGNVPTITPRRATVYAVLYANGAEVRGMTVRARYTHKKRGKRFLLHKPFSWYRPLTEIVMRASLVNRLVWRIAFWWLYTRRRTYVDPIPDFAFCMDGNSRAKKFGRRLGFRMRAHQQTFMIPATADREASIQRCTAFLDGVTADLRARNLAPHLFDVLFIPRENDIVLSSTRAITQGEGRTHLGSFAVTLLFDTSNEKTHREAKPLWRAWSKACVAMGGRVHLAKNLAIDDDDLRACYHKQLRSFLRIKRKLDPRCYITNEFFERLSRGV